MCNVAVVHRRVHTNRQDEQGATVGKVPSVSIESTVVREICLEGGAGVTRYERKGVLAVSLRPFPTPSKSLSYSLFTRAPLVVRLYKLKRMNHGR